MRALLHSFIIHFLPLHLSNSLFSHHPCLYFPIGLFIQLLLRCCLCRSLCRKGGIFFWVVRLNCFWADWFIWWEKSAGSTSNRKTKKRRLFVCVKTMCARCQWSEWEQKKAANEWRKQKTKQRERESKAISSTAAAASRLFGWLLCCRYLLFARYLHSTFSISI